MKTLVGILVLCLGGTGLYQVATHKPDTSPANQTAPPPQQPLRHRIRQHRNRPPRRISATTTTTPIATGTASTRLREPTAA